MSMTARYTLFQLDKLSDRFKVGESFPKGVKKHYNISPTQSAVVIVVRDGVRVIEMMKWGFIPTSAKNANSVFRYKTHSTKSESIFDKPTWRDAIRTQRCLVPSNGYYEWHVSSSGKKPYFIRPKDQDVFAMAGIYSSWQDPDGVTYGVYAIVTTAANNQASDIHGRMPIILRPEDEANWLDPTIADAGLLYDYMRPYTDDMLLISPVSDAVNSIKGDSPEMMTRLKTA